MIGNFPNNTFLGTLFSDTYYASKYFLIPTTAILPKKIHGTKTKCQ